MHGYTASLSAVIDPFMDSSWVVYAPLIVQMRSASSTLTGRIGNNLLMVFSAGPLPQAD
jgi:hypothetical protein